MSDALMSTYKLIWDDFCAWYLEMIKPEFVDGQPLPVCHATYVATIGFLEDLLKIIHPWMPFISEEIWHLISDRKEKDCIIISQWPLAKSYDGTLLSNFAIGSEIVQQVRNIRQQKNISPKEQLELFFRKGDKSDRSFDGIIRKLANLKNFTEADAKPLNSLSFLVNQFEFYIPLAGSIDKDAERERLTKELEYTQGVLKSVQSKLSNERFVSNAKPEVVEIEKKKQADAEAKIKAIQEQLRVL